MSKLESTSKGEAAVDVIIPTRNRPELTARAVRSVLDQTFNSLRVLVVDDCSEDELYQQLLRSLPSDSRIQVMRRDTPGGGPSARQTGFRASTATWIAILDSDDEWHPTKLARQMELVDQGDVILCGYAWETDDGDLISETIPEGNGRVRPTLTNNHDIPLIRRDVLERCGGFLCKELPDLRFDEHTEFFIRLLSVAQVRVVAEVLVRCRHHGGVRDSDGISSHPETLRQVIRLRRRELRLWPDSRSELAARLAARYAHVGSWLRAAMWLTVALSNGSLTTRRNALATAVKAVLPRARRRILLAN